MSLLKIPSMGGKDEASNVVHDLFYPFIKKINPKKSFCIGPINNEIDHSFVYLRLKDYFNFYLVCTLKQLKLILNVSAM